MSSLDNMVNTVRTGEPAPKRAWKGTCGCGKSMYGLNLTKVQARLARHLHKQHCSK